MQDGHLDGQESFEGLSAGRSAVPDDEAAGIAGTSGASGAGLGNDEGFPEVEIEDDTQDSVSATPQPTTSAKSNGFNLPSLLESDDSELEDFLDDILERGRNTLKKGTVTKVSSSNNSR